MKPKVLLLLVMSMALIVTGCRNDETGEEGQEICGCYTGQVLVVEDDESVYGNVCVKITGTPQNVDIVGGQPYVGCQITFNNNDLDGISVNKGDVIDFVVVKYKLIRVENANCLHIDHDYIGSVKPCK